MCMRCYVFLMLVICRARSAFGALQRKSDQDSYSVRAKAAEDAQGRAFARRTLLQLFDWRSFDWPMDCDSHEECSNFGIRMTCINGRCSCELKDYVLLIGRGCYPAANLFHHCITTEQCTAMNKNSYCNQNKRCTCVAGYYFDGRDCIFRYDGNLKAQEVYKAAVVAAACFIVAVVGIFVACIVRRSFCRRDANVQHSNSTSSDVFSVSDEIAALRAVDKPPSYEEVLQIERTFYGIPPPEYSAVSLRDGTSQPLSAVQLNCTGETEQVHTTSTSASVLEQPSGLESAVSPPSAALDHNSITTTALISTCTETCEVSSQTVDSPAVPSGSQDGATTSNALHQVQSAPHSGAYPIILPVLCAVPSVMRQHQCFTPPPPRPTRLHSPTVYSSAPSSPHLSLPRSELPRGQQQVPVQPLSSACASGTHTARGGESTVPSSPPEVTSDGRPAENVASEKSNECSSVAYDNPAFVEDKEK